nr:MAG TPA: hypothetical protein [Crassvirales sp.]
MSVPTIVVSEVKFSRGVVVVIPILVSPERSLRVPATFATDTAASF